MNWYGKSEIVGNIGLFGGTFDPLHIGHLILAQEARYQLELERVLWILTPNPHHKPDKEITPPGIRWEMLTREIDTVPEFSLSDVELLRKPPHYTHQTVKILRDEFPDAELIYLMGGDSLRDLPGWYKAQELVQMLDGFGVMLRPGAQVNGPGLEEELPGLGNKLHMIETPLIQISSSDIRRRIANHQPFRYFLPLSVVRFIQEKRLYI